MYSWSDSPLHAGLNPHTNGRYMDSDFGLLWIPVGFALIFLSVAVLFLTVSA